MRFKYVVLGVVLATLAISSVASATYFDIVTGLASNKPASTTPWNGSMLTQAGNNGWTYRNGGNVFPWMGTHGATFVWTTNLTDYALDAVGYGPGAADWSYGWDSGTAPNDQGGTGAGLICNGTSVGARQYGTAAGATVAFRNGWNSSYYNMMEAVWTASAAGTADVSYNVVSDAGTNTYSEFQLGLYRQGVFDSSLGWAYVTNNGTSTISATGLSLAAGDSIVLLAHAPDYNVYGTHQQNGGASGGITFTAGATTPEPGSMLALGSGLIGLAGFAIRRRK